MVLLGIGPDGQAKPLRSTPEEPKPPSATVSASLLERPLRFEPNRGQFDAPIRYLARGQGPSVYLTREGATLSLRRSDRRALVSMRLVGGRDVEPVASEALPGVNNYFVGNDPSRWKTGVESFARVSYHDVLPGVDVVYHGTGQRRFEYDLVVAPGADPGKVAVSFEGADSVAIDGEGEAVLRVSGEDGRIVQPAPVAYQVGAGGDRRHVDARYEMRGRALGFVIGAFDRTRPLVIDPTVVYSTYLGGTSSDMVVGIAVDAAGEAFLTGGTDSTDFPTASALHASASGSTDAFVTKFNAAGTAIIYSTYLGGSGLDTATGIVIDSAGEALVSGYSASPNFPTASPLQASNAGGYDAFFAKLNAAGSALVYSTYLGGERDDYAYALAIDGAGEVFLAGQTDSTAFPTASPFQASCASCASGNSDGFVSKLNAAGSALVYSTYLGGHSVANGIAVDLAQEAIVVGVTASATFPTVSPIQAVYGGNGDAFITKLSASGAALLYSTYLGGAQNDMANGVVVDRAGNAFVVGDTISSDFPTASPIQAAIAGSNDAFVTKINAAGSSLLFSTYLGGSQGEIGTGIALDSQGETIVTGYTSSTDFPVVSPFQGAYGGSFDAFVAKLNATGSALRYSSYLGGSGTEEARCVAAGPNGEAFVAGQTNSMDFPTAGAIEPKQIGACSVVPPNPPFCANDAFVTKISGSTSTVPSLERYAFWLVAALLVAGAALARRPAAPRPANG
jgi:hypothetical protein